MPAGSAAGSGTGTGTGTGEQKREGDAGAYSLRFLVKDLADGSPARDVPFWLTGKDGDGRARNVKARTDARGLLDTRLESITSIRPLDPAWRMPPRKGSGPIWIHRMVRVVGRVVDGTGGGELDPRTVELRTTFSGVSGKHPWTRNWMRIHGLAWGKPLPPPGDDGGFDVEVPRSRGMFLRGTAKGFMVATQRLVLDSRKTSIQMDLVFRRSHRVRGTLRDDDGKPIRHATLTVYATIRMPYRKLDSERAGLRGSHTIRASENGNAIVTYPYTGLTDGEGRFEIDVKASGEAHVFGWIPGFRCVAQDLGVLTDPRKDIALVATRDRQPGTVQMRFGSRPTGRGSITITDLSRGPAQPSVRVALDAKGRMPTTWLERGRRYVVWWMGEVPDELERRPMGALVWNDAPAIDLTKLVSPTDLGR